jgi:hypothetical protein
MRIWLSGPRILHGLVRPGISLGREDWNPRLHRPVGVFVVFHAVGVVPVLPIEPIRARRAMAGACAGLGGSGGQYHADKMH